MTGIFAYSTLSLIGCILLAASYRKTNKSLAFGVFFAMIGIYAIAEYFVFIWGKAYIYIPGMLRNEFLDNLLGSMISGVLCLPAMAVFIVSFSLNWGWVVAGAAWFCVVEELFRKWNIHVQVWWSTWYTFLSVMIFIKIAEFIYRKIDGAHRRFWTYGVLILTIEGIRILGAMMIYVIVVSRVYTIEWLNEVGLPSTAINLPISIVMAVIYATAIIYSKRRVWRMVAVAGIFAVDVYMKKMHYIQTVSGLDSVNYILVDMISVAIGSFFGRLYLSNEEMRSRR